MAKKLSSVLGVDIGSQKIKICEIRTQGKEPMVTALGMIDTPEGAVDHQGIYNPDAVGAALKQVISQSGASVGQVVVSIAGQQSVLVRTVEVPRMNTTELRDHMQWEVNRNVPFAESTIVSDFKPLSDEDPNSAQMDVVMAIAPQSAIDTIIQCVKKAGRTTSAIDVEPLSIARSLKTSYGDVLADKTVCVVEVGAKTASINIYRGDKLIMPRQVPIGGEMFTSAIANALTVPIEEAETIKRERCEIPASAGLGGGGAADPFGATNDFQAFNPFSDDLGGFTYGASDDTTVAGMPPVADDAAFGFTPDPTVSIPPMSSDPSVPAIAEDPEMTRLYHAYAPVLDELAGEVRRSIDYYRSRGGNVDAVELCGGGTKLKGMAEYMTRVVGVQCDAYDSLRRLSLNRKVPAAFAEEHRQEFAVAVGNGLHIFFE